MTLKGKGAVVTGGGQGIGAAVARALAAQGARVVVTARTAQRIAAVAAELGPGARAIPCDVTDQASVREMAAAAIKHLGSVDLLVNNAGAAHSAPLARQTLEDWNRIFTVNATGTFLCTQAFLPGMLERRWGRVVNVASIAGLEGARYISAYSAAKHAVVGFTRSIGAEVEGTGVTCNAVCPGFVDTDMTRESVDRVIAKTGRSRDETIAAMLGTTGQERLITPDEVAAAVLYFCGDAMANGEAMIV